MKTGQRAATWYEALDCIGEFSGRASRSEFIWCMLMIVVALFVARFFVSILFDVDQAEVNYFLEMFSAANGGDFSLGEDWLVGPLMLILWIGARYLFLACIVRRLHDFGVSGWLSLLFFIPTLDKLLFIALCLIPSSSMTNRWGDIPYSNEEFQ